MRTIKLTLAYDGTAYRRLAGPAGQPTVQGDAWRRPSRRSPAGRPCALASGRTDAGVHALGRWLSFHTDSPLAADVLQRALNAELPHDVAVLEAEEMPAGFHPIRDALRKRYRYVIHDGPVRDVFRRRYCWHYVYGRLDAEAMHRAAAGLRARTTSAVSRPAAPRGRPASAPSSTSASSGAGRGATTDHRGDRGRRISLQHGPGDRGHAGRSRPRRPAARTGRPRCLQAADRRAAGPTAPPEGLCLVQVTY